mgnify:CR=1 FL=1
MREAFREREPRSSARFTGHRGLLPPPGPASLVRAAVADCVLRFRDDDREFQAGNDKGKYAMEVWR